MEGNSRGLPTEDSCSKKVSKTKSVAQGFIKYQTGSRGVSKQPKFSASKITITLKRLDR
jgi:hypothetical protein